MQNLPRIFVDEELAFGKEIPLSREQSHYLTKVMRATKCLVFNKGTEFEANIVNSSLSIAHSTNRPDPAGNITLAFSPVKRMEDMLNMATQMGAAKLLPVITQRTVARHTNWERMKRIIIEAAEQSGRNSIPELMPEIKFQEFVKNTKNIIFADERFTRTEADTICQKEGLMSSAPVVFVGPEGGFSETEFELLDMTGATPLSLGKTILRAETAAVAALAKLGNG